MVECAVIDKVLIYSFLYRQFFFFFPRAQKHFKISFGFGVLVVEILAVDSNCHGMEIAKERILRSGRSKANAKVYVFQSVLMAPSYMSLCSLLVPATRSKCLYK